MSTPGALRLRKTVLTSTQPPSGPRYGLGHRGGLGAPSPPLDRACRPSAGGRADIGCGTGELLRDWRRSGRHEVWRRVLRRLALAHGRRVGAAGDAGRRRLARASVCRRRLRCRLRTEVLEHLKDPVPVCARFAACSPLMGWLTLSVPNATLPVSPAYSAVRAHSARKAAAESSSNTDQRATVLTAARSTPGRRAGGFVAGRDLTRVFPGPRDAAGYPKPWRR